MALPKQFIDELFARTSISRILGQFVAWDSRKTKSASGDYWACCPFHNEKTPSFHVIEKKGIYYCFGCHEKGNAIGFLQKYRKFTFRESVEFLARQAGMQIPEESLVEKRKTDQHKTLFDLIDVAENYFRNNLYASIGQSALNYIESRGINRTTLNEFGIGFVPDNQSLLHELKVHGYTEEQITQAGLSRKRDNNNGIYPVFRNRIIFPIQNYKGQTIAFGGRAMDPNAPAKYLNSPNTELFNKSSVLFNLHRARDKKNNDTNLIIVEGYMDTIALHQAGLACSVAPLGTAVTENQLHLIWRIDQNPYLALDGDVAGLRAAQRVVDTALPLLRPGISLNFCLLPQDQDPDDLVRSGGRQEFERLLSASLSIPEFIWQCEIKGKNLESPDARAMLTDSLNQQVKKIENTIVRKFYSQFNKDRIWQDIIRRQRPTTMRPGGQSNRIDTAREHVEIEQTNQQLRHTQVYFLEALILALCIRNPGIIEPCLHELESLEMSAADGHSDILSALLVCWNSMNDQSQDILDRISERIDQNYVNRLFNLRQLAIHPEIKNSTEHDEAKALLRDLLFMINAIAQSKNLTEECILNYVANESCDQSLKRLKQLQSSLHRYTSVQRMTKATVQTISRTGVEIPKSDLDALNMELAKNAPVSNESGAPKKKDFQRISRQKMFEAPNGISVPKSEIDTLRAFIKS